MNGAFVSVVIPFKIKDSNFLEQLLECFKNLDDSFFEFIFIDDCSEPAVSNNLQEKIRKISNSVYFRNSENLGVSYSRNKGIELSSGQFIMFVDSDDLLDTRILNELPSIIEKQPLKTFSCFKMKYFDKNIVFDGNYEKCVIGKRVNSKKPITDYLYFDTCYGPYMFKSACGKLFNRQVLIDNHLFFNETLRHYEDALFVSQYSLLVDEILLIEGSPLYYYRKNNGSASNHFVNDLSSQIEKYCTVYMDNCSPYFETLVLDIYYLFIPYLIKNISAEKRNVNIKDIYKILDLPFVLNSYSQFKKINLKHSVNQYLIKLQRFFKYTPRFISARFIHFVFKKYLVN